MHLRLAERGFSAVALSGDLTQNERNTALQSLRDGRSRVLVATDVAARGLDLPDLGLVIHADLPNDRETLLHRSGRTGRAGKKGTCVLIVPQTRRRRADALLLAAGVKASWGPAPSADEIRAKDQQRLISHPIFSEPANEEDLTLGRALLAGRTAEEIATALMRFHRAQLPAPEEIADPGAGVRTPYESRHKSEPGPRRENVTPWRDRAERGRPEGGDCREAGNFKRGERQDRDDMVWFRISIGREHNADPRWLLPLICRAGDVTKAEIGSIRIFDRDSRFQIAEAHADRFAAAVKATPNKQGHISRVSVKHGTNEQMTPHAVPAQAADEHRPQAERLQQVRAPERPHGGKPGGFKTNGFKGGKSHYKSKPAAHAGKRHDGPNTATKSEFKKKPRSTQGG
jgi:ATP-dependent RNA helicase DeaD